MTIEYPGITCTPGVCGGEPCVANTRIPVWSIANWRILGLSDVEILENYPTLKPGDLENAWKYIEDHEEEIRTQIKENEED